MAVLQPASVTHRWHDNAQRNINLFIGYPTVDADKVDFLNVGQIIYNI
jgi:hypothetical protein